MATQLEKSLESLKRCIDSQRPKESLELIKNVLKYFERTRTDAELALAFESVFNEQTGTIAFLKRTVSTNKLFKDSNIEILALYRKLIVDFTDKIKQYNGIILDIMMIYVKSSLVSAKEKELSVLVIQELVIRKFCGNAAITEIIKQLLSIFATPSSVSSLPARYTQFIFELIGVISRDYPRCFEDDDVYKFRDTLFYTLESMLLNQIKVSYLVIAGAFQAFDYFFNNFGPDPTTEPIICNRIYECARKVSDPGEVRERAAFRASLTLVTHHGRLMSSQLTRDWSYWHNTLRKWLKWSYEDRKVAIYALQALYQEIGRVLEERTDSSDFAICNYFKAHFRDILLNSTSKIYEVRIAVRGIGLMAGAFAKPDAAELNGLLTLMIQKFEYMYMMIADNNRDVTEHLPDFVQALSHVMGHIEYLSSVQIASLQSIMRALIRDFHYLSQVHHELVVSSLMKTFYNLSKLGGRIMDGILDKCILEGVALTCSHKLLIEEDWVTFPDWKDNITLKNYLPLWLGLLRYVEFSDYNRAFISGKIYDKLIETLIKIIGKLNLNTKKRSFKDESGVDQELYFCDPNIDLTPVNVHDFRIAINLVDFYRKILSDKQLSVKYGFEKWISVYIETMMLKSLQHPLVSAFMKLLSYGLRIADHINYFNGENAELRRGECELLSDYMKKVLVRAEQTSGELQISCLLLIFSTPIEILVTSCSNLSGIFCIAFDIGKNLLWLADYALNTLDKIITATQSNKESQELLLKAVLPSLDSYLISKGFETKAVAANSIPKYRRSIKVKRMPQQTTTECTESKLTKLQRKIILFLGKLDPNICLHLITPCANSDTNALVKWEVGQKIRLFLRQCYDDNKLIVYLDNLLPQIRILALTSSDRKTKVSACEFIHACVAYLMGTDMHQGEMWTRLSETLFYLGCDSDSAVREMFEPLLMQIMHYISQSSQLGSPGTDIILDVMMNLISHPSNCGLRDLTAKCLREYVEWIIRLKVEDSDREVGNIYRNKIIERIISLSFDSDPCRRFGASLAFNNIYRILREEEDVIKVYWLEFLYVYCTNFSMSEDVSCDLEQNKATIDHIARVICERSDWFELQYDNRIQTSVYEEATLKGALMWIFQQCGSRLINYRRKCMEIYCRLVKYVKAYSGESKQFINANFTRDSLLEIFEIKIQEFSNLLAIRDQQNLPIVAVRNWFYNFLATLDCWTWILNEDLIMNGRDLMPNSIVFSVMAYYLNELCWTSAKTIFEQGGVAANDAAKHIVEMSKVDKCKCHILVMIINFTIVLLDRAAESVPQDLWCPKFRALICDLIFAPQRLDLDLLNHDVMGNLPVKIEKLIKLVNQKAEREFVRKLNREIGEFLLDKLGTLINVADQDSVQTDETNIAKGVRFVVHNIKWFNIETSQWEEIESALSQLINGIFERTYESRIDILYSVHPLPSIKSYNNILLDIYLTNSYRRHLLPLIFDTEHLQSTEKNNIHRGDHFLDIYRDIIFYHFYRHSQNFTHEIMTNLNETNVMKSISLITEMCEFIFKSRMENGQLISTLIDGVLNNWPRLLELCRDVQDREMNLIGFMANLAAISSYSLQKLGEKAVGFADWLLAILINPGLKLEVKSWAIQLLPLITGVDSTADHPNLLDSLAKFQAAHFPLRSNEFSADSQERNNYIIAFQAVLYAVVVSKSPTLLHYLIKITAADEKHIVEWQIRETLTNYMKSLRISQQVAALTLVFTIFCDEQLEYTLRHNILKRFIKTLVQTAYTPSLIQFYTENIKKIDELTMKSLSSHIITSNLNARIAGYTLIELMIAKIPTNYLTSPESEISLAFFASDLSKIKTGKELIRDLMKRAYTSRTEYINISTVTDEISELIRLYHCSVYNTLIAIVSNTQVELKFYESLLFKEKPNDFIWRNFINTRRGDLYQFEPDFEEYPKIKNRVISIRGVQTDNQKRLSIKYLQSVSIFESSLSQDLTKIDLTNSMVRDADDVSNIEEYEDIGSVRLEKVPINDHEVMANICALIQHMATKKITPVDGGGIPEWVKNIGAVMSNGDNHKNVRLFLAKLVENCRHIMKAYAAVLLAPILSVIVDDCAGCGLNTFVVDLMAMVLSWHTTHTPANYDEISLASQALKYLMKSCFNEKRDILKVHLELIKTLVEVWKSTVTIPSQLLYDLINTPRNRHELNCGLHLIAIVLANDIVPWSDLTRNDFLKAIILCINNEATTVYQSAAQLLGMCFAHISPGDDDQFLMSIKSSILEIRKKDDKKSTDILYNIQKHYPQMLDSFLHIICCNIPNAIGAVKRINLEMLLARVEFFGDTLFRELISIGIRDLLKHGDYQLLALHILNRAIPTFTSENISQIISDIIEFVDAPSRDCRDVTFEILIFISDGGGSSNIPIGDELRKMATTNLLIGLTDTDPIIQARAFNYWSTEKNYPNFFDRFATILELYDPKTEKHFLSYATQLLLDPIIKHPQSKERLFVYREEHDTKFSEYTINTKWHSQSSTIMSPLFIANTQGQESSISAYQLGRLPLVRATQTQLKFEPTQDPSTLSPATDRFTLGTQTSFLFDTKSQTLNRRSQNISNTDSPIQDFEAKFRKRFIRDKDQQSRQQALKAVDRRQYNKSKTELEMKHREKEVVLYRRYRDGEYPDMLITPLAILLPLQGLVNRDPIIARQVFVSLFTSIVSNVDRSNHNLFERLGTQIENILKNTRQWEPILIGTMLEVALIAPQITSINANIVTLASTIANVTSGGILYLERRLNANTSDGSSSKVSSGSLDAESHLWIKLSELYNELSESDVVASIYSEKLQSNPALLKGIQYENEGNYQFAQKEYLRIISAVQSNPVEQDFCYQSFYNCFAYMGQWSELAQAVSQQVSSFDEFWSEWNKENLLPHYIRAELRRILSCDADNREFLNIMESWLRDPEHQEYLTLHFSEEIMMLQVANSEYLQSRVLSERALKYFLSDWGQLSIFSSKLRSSKLLNIKKIAEIYNNINFFITPNDDYLPQLIASWQNTDIPLSDSLTLWDTILAYRTTITNIISENFQQHLHQYSIDSLYSSLTRLTFRLLDVTYDSNNMPMYEKLITTLAPLRDRVADPLALEWQLARCKAYMLKARLKSSPEQSVKLLIKGWSKIKENVLESLMATGTGAVKPKIQIKAVNEIGIVCEEIMRLTEKDIVLAEMDLEQIMMLANTNTHDNISQRLLNHSIYCLRQCIDIAEEFDERNRSQESVEIKADAYNRAAQFYYEHHGSSLMSQDNEFEKNMIVAVLRSMKYESKDARMLLPTVLQFTCLAEDDNLAGIFNEEIEGIPDWMFLEWIPQILSQFNFAVPCFLDNLLLKLSKAYPAALVYAFRLSYDQYIATKTHRSTSTNRDLVMNIRNHLTDDTTENFITGILNLCIPYVKLKYHCDKLFKFLTVPAFDELILVDDYKYELDSIDENVFEKNAGNTSDMYLAIVSYRNKIKDLRVLDPNTERETIKAAVREFCKQLENQPRLKEIKTTQLSSWLGNFKSINDKDVLEMPGQYTGKMKPLVQSHIKITHVSSMVQVFESLRKPIKIRIYGNNGRSYNFLVKYGEDLRQDQRIQKLFSLMSSQMYVDPNCRRHELSVQTYEVIPISNVCGMTSWLENTMTLRSFLDESIKRRYRDEESHIQRAWEKYNAFAVDKLKKTRDIIVAHFREITNMIPADLMKYALVEYSVSPESFYVLRNNFATSLAANNIAQWVLGIGDRNQSNIMIDITNGRITSIDFGYSFGSGIRDVGIPELVPFRLTPQIVNVMLPMGVSGQISKCMVHTLRCLSRTKRLLMTCMEVFVKEPSIDWLETVRERSEVTGRDNRLWNAADRIECASKKLSGYNPCELNKIELKSSVIAKKNINHFNKYMELLSGVPQFNIRARLPESGLSVEEQVEALIDMATDPAILGVTFAGFQPFV